MLWRKAEILAAERADNKARSRPSIFTSRSAISPEQLISSMLHIHRPDGYVSPRRFYAHEGADFGVINNLTTSGLEDFSIAAVTSR